MDSLDWTDPGPAAIRATVAASVRPGSVVSLHLGHAGTLAALPDVLTDLHRRGLRPVTASTLLGPVSGHESKINFCRGERVALRSCIPAAVVQGVGVGCWS